MIRYFVRTTGQRILDDSYSQIEYELLIDNNGHSGKAFLAQLSIINEYDCVVLEDDLILCRGFKDKIEAVIKEHKDKIINFFTSPLGYFKSRESRIFSYNQCTYFPKGMGGKIYEAVKIFPTLQHCQERIMREGLLRLGLTFFQYRPCLVQHLDTDSLMGHKMEYPRRSPYFEDYLNDLNIPYGEANTASNRAKLREYMEEQFKALKQRKEREQ